MTKKLMLSSLLALGVVGTASAANFSTAFDVTKTLTPITLAQKTAMVLPSVTVDQGTPVSVPLCATTGADFHPGKGYCNGNTSNGVYTISGAPHATLSVTFPTAPIYKDGFSFRGYSTISAGQVHALDTDAAGNLDVEIEGHLYLEDLSLVTSKAYVIDFPLTAVYY